MIVPSAAVAGALDEARVLHAVGDDEGALEAAVAQLRDEQRRLGVVAAEEDRVGAWSALTLVTVAEKSVCPAWIVSVADDRCRRGRSLTMPARPAPYSEASSMTKTDLACRRSP